MSDNKSKAGRIRGDQTVTNNPPAYYFDLTPLKKKSVALRDPERLTLICQNHVRQIAPDELFVATGDGFLLVIQSRSGTAAETLVADVNLALTRHFLGTESLAGGKALYRAAACEELDSAGVDMIALGKSLARTAQHEDSFQQQLRETLHSPNSCEQSLSHAVIPLINLKNGRSSIELCTTACGQDGADLFAGPALGGEGADHSELDETLLGYSLRLVQDHSERQSTIAVCTSVGFETLARSRSRQRYQYLLRAAAVASNPLFLVMIDGVPVGTPGSRLADVVASVRPFVRRVFVQLTDNESGAFENGNLGIAGICARMPDCLTALDHRLAVLARVAKLQQALTAIHGVPSPALFSKLQKAGLRFAALRPGATLLEGPNALCREGLQAGWKQKRAA